MHVYFISDINLTIYLPPVTTAQGTRSKSIFGLVAWNTTLCFDHFTDQYVVAVMNIALLF